MTTFARPSSLRPKKLHANCAAELMTVDPLAFEKHLPIPTARALLQLNRLESAPVVTETGRLVGVVSRESFAAWEEFSLRSSPYAAVWGEHDLTPVWQIASSKFQCVGAGASASEVMHRLVRDRARLIYVVDRDGKLVGVVSMTDLFRGLLECDKPEKVA